MNTLDAPNRSIVKALQSKWHSHRVRQLAAVHLPGPYYFSILEQIHALLRPKTYMEIGVARGESMALAAAETRAVGIDPSPGIISTIHAKARIYPTTSDDFFARYNLQAELEGASPDLAFIDGMHLLEYALRDFINVEAQSHAKTVILIHDCLPLTQEMAFRERETKVWTGDVWRIIPLLKKYRPDLQISVIPTSPSGLAVVTNLDPSSRILGENLDAVIAEFLRLDFPENYDTVKTLLNVVTNDPATLKRLLPRID